MPRYVKRARTSKKTSRRRSSFSRSRRYHAYGGYRSLSRRISAVSRRVAGEVCKFESTPSTFTNSLVIVGTSNTQQSPLTTITSGEPWIYPINWTYSHGSGLATGLVYADGQQLINGQTYTLSFRNPIWYNTMTANTDEQPTSQDANELINDVSPGLQYRLKYIYINALFNASVSQSVNNTDGALRVVIVKDKQPSGGAATWYDAGGVVNGENHRGVFNANRIDAQLNPNTVGRFKIMYDKTLRFNTTNGYKPFKYYKQLSTTVRNTRDIISYNTTSTASISNSLNKMETSSRPPPVLKNAFYMMVFSDGLNFTYSTDATTPPAGFHMFNRVAYFNN